MSMSRAAFVAVWIGAISLSFANDLEAIAVRPLTAAELAVESAPRILGQPYRVGHPIKFFLTPRNGGVWQTEADGTQVWRATVTSRGARWLVLGFGVFRPIPGASLGVWNADRTQQLGPFTSADEQAHGLLYVGPVFGDRAEIELRWPAGSSAQSIDIELNLVSHGFRGFEAGTEKTLGESGACNIDVRCPLGDLWQDEKRGVVLMLKNGSDWCTGSLVNNTTQNCKPLILTANHCLSTQADTNQMQWVFNFERSACGSGSASTAQQISGGTFRAAASNTDFSLVELNQAVPDAWAPYYNGWSRSSSAATQATGIHHPSGDAKKISRDDSGTVLGSNWGTTHWRVPSWDQGVTEGGSSGSPLFDQNSRIIGQLHGGESSCSVRTWDEYGRFDLSWDGGGTNSTRLKNWLDSANLNPPTLNGLDYQICLVPNADLRYSTHRVDDAAGNANGSADPGETFKLPITVLNQGNTNATGVSGTLSTGSAGVTITDASSLWPDVPNTQTRETSAPHFEVRLAESVSCGSLLPFTLNVISASPASNNNSTFDLRVGAAQVTTGFSDQVEAGVGSWTTNNVEGANPWQITTSDSVSPTHSWFVNDIGTRSASDLLMQQLNALPAQSELRFMHRYRTESGWDGGVLEYSANGGPFTDANSLIVQGGYNSTINSSAGSILAGRSAWVGDSGGWQSVRVDLASLAGANVRFRWRFATDDSVSSTGWFVDDVVVDSTSYVCSTPAALPGEASAEGSNPFRIQKVVGGFSLTWSAPITGGAATRYSLYRHGLPMTGASTPACEADLGAGTSTTLANLTSDHGFLVVARNAAGEGSYGMRSNGTERTKATGGSVCP